MMHQESYHDAVFRFDRKISTPRQTFFESRLFDHGKDGRDGRREASTTARTATKIMRMIMTKTRSHVIT